MFTKQKIKSRKEAASLIEEWREKGLSVVFSNGCFDILHLGHVDYLERARALGDKLVVALNTDSSVQILKGPNRPIANEESRGRVMASLSFVDLVVFFDEETPKELIRTLKPDVLVKGGDYSLETIVGAEDVISFGGKVLTLPLIGGYSTTNFVEKIKKTGENI